MVAVPKLPNAEWMSEHSNILLQLIKNPSQTTATTYSPGHPVHHGLAGPLSNVFYQFVKLKYSMIIDIAY